MDTTNFSSLCFWAMNRAWSETITIEVEDFELAVVILTFTSQRKS